MVDPMVKGRKGRGGGFKKALTPVSTPVEVPAVAHSTVPVAPTPVTPVIGGADSVSAPQSVGSTTTTSSLPGSTTPSQLIKVICCAFCFHWKIQ